MANIPPDFTSALKAAGLAGFFANCTAPHQNEYLKWIAEAKKTETRQKRIAKAVQRIGIKQTEEEERAKKKSLKMPKAPADARKTLGKVHKLQNAVQHGAKGPIHTSMGQRPMSR
jgi:hypothetical protein